MLLLSPLKCETLSGTYYYSLPFCARLSCEFNFFWFLFSFFVNKKNISARFATQLLRLSIRTGQWSGINWGEMFRSTAADKIFFSHRQKAAKLFYVEISLACVGGRSVGSFAASKAVACVGESGNVSLQFSVHLSLMERWESIAEGWRGFNEWRTFPRDVASSGYHAPLDNDGEMLGRVANNLLVDLINNPSRRV